MSKTDPLDPAEGLRDLYAEMERLRAIEKACGDIVERLTQTELQYHMYPSFDRPVEGCGNCEVVDAARAALREKGAEK